MSQRRYMGRTEPIALIMSSSARNGGSELRHSLGAWKVSQKAGSPSTACTTSSHDDGLESIKSFNHRVCFPGSSSSPDDSDLSSRANLVAEIERKKALEAELKQKLIYTLQERIWVSQALDRAHQAIKEIVTETGGVDSPFHDEYFATPEPPTRPISIYDRPPRRNTLRRTSASMMDWSSTKRGSTQG